MGEPRWYITEYPNGDWQVLRHYSDEAAIEHAIGNIDIEDHMVLEDDDCLTVDVNFSIRLRKPCSVPHASLPDNTPYLCGSGFKVKRAGDKDPGGVIPVTWEQFKQGRY